MPGFGWGFERCYRDEFLEETPISAIDVDFIYSTGPGLEVGVNALYNRYRRYNVPSGEGDPLRANLFFMVAHDLGQVRTYFTPYNDGHNASNGYLGYKWTQGYQLIDRCNAIIQAADNIEYETKDYLVAQAKVIRGEIYLDLLRMYDNILLDTTATTPDNVDDEITYAPADPADVHALIESDLQFAIANLEYDEPYGRYSKATARHLLGKNYMWEGKWALAAAQFDAVITESGKSLVAVNQVFGQNLDHSEMLFAVVRDELLGSTGAGDDLAGGAGTWLSSTLINRLYEMSSGDFIHTPENGGQALGWAAPNDYLQSLYGDVTIPDATQPHFRRVITEDLRYRNYFMPETYAATNPNSPRFGQEILVYDDNARRYHFSSKKYFDLEKGALTNDSWKDWPMYRLAETYLLGSEAHWRNGNTTKALEYINTVRRRAFGVNDATHDFLTYDLETYLEESARELAQERNRFFLLKRLGLLVERQNEHYRFGQTTANFQANQFPMADYMGTLPIPQSQIDLMGTFPQNPGYPQ